jgi:hypothetical protein
MVREYMECIKTKTADIPILKIKTPNKFPISKIKAPKKIDVILTPMLSNGLITQPLALQRV